MTTFQKATFLNCALSTFLIKSLRTCGALTADEKLQFGETTAEAEALIEHWIEEVNNALVHVRDHGVNGIFLTLDDSPSGLAVVDTDYVDPDIPF